MSDERLIRLMKVDDLSHVDIVGHCAHAPSLTPLVNLRSHEVCMSADCQCLEQARRICAAIEKSAKVGVWRQTMGASQSDLDRQAELMEAVKSNQWEKASNLISAGADVNFVYDVESETTTLLMTAVIANELNLVERLVERGADGSFVDDLGWTTLLYACWEDYISQEIGLYLLKKDSSLAQCRTHLGFTPLHFAALSGKDKIVEHLLRMENTDPDAIAVADYGTGITPLSMACRYPKAHPEEKLTPVQKKKLKDRRRTILLLIQAGADVDVIDRTAEGHGYTPLLQCMVCQGDYQKWQPDFGVICYLVLNGADTNIKSYPPVSSDDQDIFSTTDMACMCLTEAETPGRIDLQLFNRMSCVFELLNDMKSNTPDLARQQLEASFLQGQLLAQMETIRAWGVVRLGSIPGALNLGLKTAQAIEEAMGTHPKGYKNRRLFVQYWPYSYYHTAKLKLTVSAFVKTEVTDGIYDVDAKKIKKDGDVKKKGSDYLRFYMRAGLEKQLAQVSAAFESVEQGKRVPNSAKVECLTHLVAHDTIVEGGSWEKTLWILLLLPGRCLSLVQSYLLNPFLTKAIQTISQATLASTVVGPFLDTMKERRAKRSKSGCGL